MQVVDLVTVLPSALSIINTLFQEFKSWQVLTSQSRKETEVNQERE